jgi:hypothetical protein
MAGLDQPSINILKVRYFASMVAWSAAMTVEFFQKRRIFYTPWESMAAKKRPW